MLGSTQWVRRALSQQQQHHCISASASAVSRGVVSLGLWSRCQSTISPLTPPPAAPLSEQTLHLNASNLQVPKIEHRQPLPTSKLVCSLVLSAYMRDHLDFVSYFARHSASQMSLVTDPIIHLPTDWKQYSVLVSPFVHAKFKQIFEKKTHKRCIQVYDGHPETVRAWVDYVVKKMPAGIDVHVDQYQWVPLDYQPPEEPPRPLRLSEKKSFETLVKEKADEYLKKFSS